MPTQIDADAPPLEAIDVEGESIDLEKELDLLIDEEMPDDGSGHDVPMPCDAASSVAEACGVAKPDEWGSGRDAHSGSAAGACGVAQPDDCGSGRDGHSGSAAEACGVAVPDVCGSGRDACIGSDAEACPAR